MIGENHHRQYTTGEYPMIDFGECLKKAQQEKNVNSSQLARLVGVHRQQVNIWRNKTNVRLDTAIKICSALEYNLDEFIGL
jgi:DNA-binding Xre family transcriptional regulator